MTYAMVRRSLMAMLGMKQRCTVSMTCGSRSTGLRTLQSMGHSSAGTAMHTWHDIWAERALTSQTCLWSKQHMHVHHHGQGSSVVTGSVLAQSRLAQCRHHSSSSVHGPRSTSHGHRRTSTPSISSFSFLGFLVALLVLTSTVLGFPEC